MMKKLVVLCLIGAFLLSGCEQLKELYGIQPSGGEESVPLEEIKIQEEISNITELPPTPPEEAIGEVDKTLSEELPQEEVKEVAEEKPVAETAPVNPKEGAKVLIVEETNLVSLKPKADDPDKDKLTFSYTTPIGQDGKWQTKYGDAGEYSVTITASDGQLTTTKDILIIVNKKEEAPVIDESVPKEESLAAKENSKIDFSVKASDLNKDPLTYSWKLDGKEGSKGNSYTYDIGYDGAGQHTVKIVVSDGVKEVSNIWAVKVANVNRKPVLTKIPDIKAKETETITLEPIAADPDNDKLIFSVDSDKFRKVDNKFEWKTTYDDAGEYSVNVMVSDGEDDVSQAVKITIENVNRPPVIEDITLG